MGRVGDPLVRDNVPPSPTITPDRSGTDPQQTAAEMRTEFEGARRRRLAKRVAALPGVAATIDTNVAKAKSTVSDSPQQNADGDREP
jgi:hypothetical protein